MNFKSITSTLLILISIGNLAIAQQGSKDPKAKAILDAMSEKSKSFGSLSANFVYKLENLQDGIDEEQEGKIILKGDKYVLDIAGQQLTNNGSTMWTYIEEDSEVQINEVDPEEEDMISPSKLFTLYNDDFNFKYETTETDGNGSKVDVVKLFPINPEDKGFHTIILKVNQSDKMLNSVVIKGKDGNTYTYLLSNLNTSTTYEDSFFEFDVSKAEEVIDLR